MSKSIQGYFSVRSTTLESRTDIMRERKKRAFSSWFQTLRVQRKRAPKPPQSNQIKSSSWNGERVCVLKENLLNFNSIGYNFNSMMLEHFRPQSKPPPPSISQNLLPRKERNFYACLVRVYERKKERKKKGSSWFRDVRKKERVLPPLGLSPSIK